MPRPLTYRRIVALAELNDHDARVIRQAGMLAKASGAELHLLHIVDVAPSLDGGMGLTPGQEASAYEALVLPRLHRLAQASEGAVSACHVRVGQSGPAFQQFAREHMPDLVVTTRQAPHVVHGPWDVLVLKGAPVSWLNRLKRWSTRQIAGLPPLTETA